MSHNLPSCLTLLVLVTASGGLQAADNHPIAQKPDVRLVRLSKPNVSATRPICMIMERSALSALRQRQAERENRLTRHLEQEHTALGLGLLDGFRALNRWTDRYGSTHVRYNQTYRGVQVFQGLMLGHLDAADCIQPPHTSLHRGIDLEPAVLLSEDQIRRRIAHDLPVGHRLLDCRMEPVVFPTRYQDGLKVVRDGEGNWELDGMYSVGTPGKADPYRWAFHVYVNHEGADTEYILDGLTGEILKKWNGRVYADEPAVGTGNTQYNGTVQLNVLKLGSTNQYTLRDTTRGHKVWDFVPNWPEINKIGIQTVYYEGNNYQRRSRAYDFLSPVDTWGDGMPFVFAVDFPGQLKTARGQTAGADVHFAAMSCWDYFQNVFGRDGFDGEGTAPVCVVHMTNSTNSVLNNAYWESQKKIFCFGDGAATGSLACLDVVAHEYGHGVNTFSANLSSGESRALNEANSDVHATMVKFYVWGAEGQGGTIPDHTTKAPDGHNTISYLYAMAPQLSASGEAAMRVMYKPSLDGVSLDSWFQGIAFNDEHYSCGPGNRAFFFLCQGAANDPGYANYSVHLPEGMSGIGNDKAAHIWYHAMTTKVADRYTDYHGFRECMVAASSELFPGSGGTDSVETAAVKNAFAAVNVGLPASGASRVMISFPPSNNGLFDQPQVYVAPSLVSVQVPKPVVTGAVDTGYTLDFGGLSARIHSGGLLENGRFTAPLSTGAVSWPIQAVSLEDPDQHAVCMFFGVNLDVDQDTDTDACDTGVMALSYGSKMYARMPGGELLGKYKECEFGLSAQLIDVYGRIFLDGFARAYQSQP